jgi:hypothetical protein
MFLAFHAQPVQRKKQLLQFKICVALAAIQTTGKPAIFKGISQRQAKARPSGRRLVLSLRGALAGCLLWEHGVCAFLGFC